MTPAEALTLSRGDELMIDPLWNHHESRRERQVASPVRILAVRHDSMCQSRVMVTVPTLTGHQLELDAGWFERKRQEVLLGEPPPGEGP